MHQKLGRSSIKLEQPVYILNSASIVGTKEGVLKENNIDKRKIKAIASIDIKKDEKAILKLSKELNVPFITYSKDELANVQGDFISSNFVKSITGVDNVCERAVKCFYGSEIVVKKLCENGFTLSIGYQLWQGSF